LPGPIRAALGVHRGTRHDNETSEDREDEDGRHRRTPEAKTTKTGAILLTREQFTGSAPTGNIPVCLISERADKNVRATLNCPDELSSPVRSATLQRVREGVADIPV
jgi:hypothetical protein